MNGVNLENFEKCSAGTRGTLWHTNNYMKWSATKYPKYQKDADRTCN